MGSRAAPRDAPRAWPARVARPVRTGVASSPIREAVNNSPIGRPSTVQCNGSDIDGWPVTFATIVNGAASNTGLERLENLVALAQQCRARQRGQHLERGPPGCRQPVRADRQRRHTHRRRQQHVERGRPREPSSRERLQCLQGLGHLGARLGLAHPREHPGREFEVLAARFSTHQGRRQPQRGGHLGRDQRGIARHEDLARQRQTRRRRARVPAPTVA